MFAIDLGSNTLRAVLMNDNFDKIKEEEYIIGAARNLIKDNKINEQTIYKLKLALQDLQQKGYMLENTLAVATAAFRKASNTKEIFEELKNEFKINFKVIDAISEAKFSILGMQNGLEKIGFKEKKLAYCDLGGASCELSFQNNFKSFDFGIITFFEKQKRKPYRDGEKLNFNAIFKKYPLFLKKTRDKKIKLNFLLADTKLKILAFSAFDEIKNAKKHLRNFRGKNIVLNSGVPTAIIALKHNICYESYNAKNINGKSLHLNDFLLYAIKLHNMNDKNAKIWVGEARKNYLIAGCFLFYALFNKEHFIVVDDGLREGICIAKAKNLF